MKLVLSDKTYKRRDESSTGDGRVTVHNGLLHVTLNGLDHTGLQLEMVVTTTSIHVRHYEYAMYMCTYIGDGAESSNGRGSVLVLLSCHVLRQTAGDDDDIIGNLGHLLDGEVDEPTKGQVM